MKPEIKTVFEGIIADNFFSMYNCDMEEIFDLMAAAYNLALIDASEAATVLQHNIVTGIPESKSHTSNLLGKIIVDKKSILDLKIL